nr:MAG TPA: hypothetical protein [Caudoviricetes sp.]
MAFCAFFLLFRGLPALFHSYSCANLCKLQTYDNGVRVGQCIHKRCHWLRKRT